MLKFNWDNPADLYATVEFRGDDDNLALSHDIHLNDLQPKAGFEENSNPKHCVRGSGWFMNPLPLRWSLLLSSILVICISIVKLVLSCVNFILRPCFGKKKVKKA